MSIECPSCEKTFPEIGKHWYASSSCSHPSFTQKQKDVITGILMGDGTVVSKKTQVSNPILSCGMINRDYLEYLNSEVFPVIGNRVHLKKTAEEQAESHRKSGFRSDADGEEYHDVYRWYTRTHPDLKEFEEWYSSGYKVFPDGIDMTPDVLKHWYVGDGHFETGKYSTGRVSIATSNELGEKSKIENYFDAIGFDDYYWKVSEREGGFAGSINFSTELTEDIFEYMGEPLPGFEYKWPNEEIE